MPPCLRMLVCLQLTLRRRVSPCLIWRIALRVHYKGQEYSDRTHQSGLPAKNPQKLVRSQVGVFGHFMPTPCTISYQPTAPQYQVRQYERLIYPKENTIVRISGPPPAGSAFGVTPRFRDISADRFHYQALQDGALEHWRRMPTPTPRVPHLVPGRTTPFH